MASSAIKQELIDCGSLNTTSMNSNSLKFSVPHGANDVISISMSTNSNPKMGSRRIFTPQFKLQVLESYRNDSDCKGNQRATARKYNIHRRQIQKWLQCESNLRSSVANINQSNVKHQFHNVSHDHHQHNQQQKQNTTITSRNKHYNYGNSQYPLHHQLSLDTARHRVALNSPAQPTLVLQNSSTIAKQEASAMANLAPVVANSAGAMTLVPTQSSPSKSSAVALVRPTAIGGSSGTILKSMLHTYHHHYDQYPMPYTLTPASIPVSVPTITHSPPQLHNHSYQNLTHHSNSLTHEQQSSLYLPSTSLPVIVLSAASSVTTTKYEVEHEKATAIQSEEIKKCNELHPLKSAAPTILTQATGSNEEYIHRTCDHIKNVYSKDVYKIDRNCELLKQTFSLLPMDLSLGQKRSFGENLTTIEKTSDKNYNPFSTEVGHSKPPEKNDLVVDLTFRKRKVITNFVVNKNHEKKAKNSDSAETFSANFHEIGIDKDEEHQEDIEVGLEQQEPAPKPIKLFKPYLLDKEDTKVKPVRDNEPCNPFMWSHHSDCLCQKIHDNCEFNHQSSLFQSPSYEKHLFHAESSDLYNNKNTCNQSSISPQSPLQLSPEGLRCPKGSPVSGYESSSSTYSDMSSKGESRKNSNTKAYSIDVKLHPILNNNLILNESNIKKWLDQEYINLPRSPSSSIALYI